jgi:hypothetical protein
MILTTHILSGALIGAKIKNPFYIAVISIAVHFVMDTFPHGDYLNEKSKLKEFWKVAIDLAIGLGLVFSVLFIRGDLSNPVFLENIAIGIFFSLFPDGTTFLYSWMKLKFLRPIKHFHEKLHFHPALTPEREFRLKNNLWDIIISLATLLLLIITP